MSKLYLIDGMSIVFRAYDILSSCVIKAQSHVTQMVEQWTGNQRVGGLIPSPTTFNFLINN